MILWRRQLYFCWWSCGGGYETSLLWMLLEGFRVFSNFISVLSFVEMSCDIMWHDIIWHNIWYDIYKIMLDAFGMFSLVFQFYVCLIIWWNVLFCDMTWRVSILFVSMCIVCFDFSFWHALVLRCGAMIFVECVSCFQLRYHTSLDKRCMMIVDENDSRL